MSARSQMKLGRVGIARVFCLALSAALAGGCANCRLPRIDPTGEHIFARQTPPLTAQPAPPFAPTAPPLAAAAPGAAPIVGPVGPRPPFGSSPTMVMLTPSQVVAPIGSEVVLIAGVGTDGYLKSHQRVEWTLSADSVGSFVSPGTRRPFAVLDLLHRSPRKIDSRYVVNRTLFSSTTINRGTPTPLDDITVQGGQAWASVVSPTEGTSNVIVYSPSVDAWDRRQQTASIYWVNAQWRFPTPAISNIGSRNTLTTVVSRQSDGTPLPGWEVRYELAGGPEAGLGAEGASTASVVTSETGEASIEISQKQDVAGVNPINIQVIRPVGAGGQAHPLTIGSGSTSQTWAAVPGTAPTVQAAPAEPAAVPQPAAPTTPSPVPQAATGAAELDVTVGGTQSAVVGGQVQTEIQVVNRGTATATKLLITDRFDVGLKHSRTASPMERDLADLRPGASVRLTVNFEAIASGQQCQDIEVTGEGGLRASARHCVSVADREVQPPASEAWPPSQPRSAEPPLQNEPPAKAQPAGSAISVRVTGPDRRRVGESALVTIEVTNTTQQQLEELVIADRFPSTLEPNRATEGNEWLEGGAMGWKVASLAPGRSLQREIEFKCLREAVRACNRVTVSARGMQPTTEEACVEIATDAAEQPAAAQPESPLHVSVVDTSDPIRIDGETTYQVQVENEGDKSQFNVAVSIALSEEIKLVNAAGPVQGSVTPGAIKFAPIRELRAGETPLTYEVKAKGVRAGTGRIRVEVTAQGQPRPATGEQTTQVLP
jgi:hypothetical protein